MVWIVPNFFIVFVSFIFPRHDLFVYASSNLEVLPIYHSNEPFGKKHLCITIEVVSHELWYILSGTQQLGRVHCWMENCVDKKSGGHAVIISLIIPILYMVMNIYFQIHSRIRNLVVSCIFTNLGDCAFL